jgi:citrate/tricarballylate utilization protein
MALSVAAILILAMVLQNPDILFAARAAEPGAFYAVIPYPAMVWTAGITFVFSILALIMGFTNFWRDAGPREPVTTRALGRAILDVLSLRNLGGGGAGCNDRNEALSGARKHFHHAMFYGFALCFAATSVATIYHHFLGLAAPYPLLSLPVILGTLGGIGMSIGAGGLLVLRVTADQAPSSQKLLGADIAMIFLLGMSALTGLALLAFRTTGSMGILLAIHLGFVLALFLTLPYSRMVHGLYRAAALLRSAIEHQK